MSSILSLIVFCGTFMCVYGWGANGHVIIAQLAQSQLNQASLDWTRSLIPWHWNGNISSMASWADNILHANSNPHGYPNWQWSRGLHYINMPDWNCTYIVERDCVNDTCIDGAIRNYTKILESDLDIIQHQEALYFLIHYVGDIHQPLHVSFESDYGGNSVKGRFLNRTFEYSLHSLWDSTMLLHRIQTDFFSNTTLYYEHMHKLMLQQSPTVNDNDVRQWAQESSNLVCQQVYFDDNNKTMNASIPFRLNQTYYLRSIEKIEERLAQAGRRLGVLLNRLGQNRPIKSGTNKLFISIYILIPVLIAEFIILNLIYN